VILMNKKQHYKRTKIVKVEAKEGELVLLKLTRVLNDERQLWFLFKDLADKLGLKRK